LFVILSQPLPNVVCVATTAQIIVALQQNDRVEVAVVIAYSKSQGNNIKMLSAFY